jgi:anti-anti-sigma factor
MFGKSKQSDDGPGDPYKARAEGFHAKKLPKNWLTSDPEHDLGDSKDLATYDRLGQTLVATMTVDALAGHDAICLAAEVYHLVAGTIDDKYAGVRHVVFDVQNVQYMDSTCVGVFVELLTKLQGLGGRIALVNADQNVEYLFKLTRLDRLFPICRDVMKAIEAVERAG